MQLSVVQQRRVRIDVIVILLFRVERLCPSRVNFLAHMRVRSELLKWIAVDDMPTDNRDETVDSFRRATEYF